MDLVSAWDKNGKNWATPNIGIPQGSSISPVLMNVYLHSRSNGEVGRIGSVVLYPLLR